MKQTLFVFFLLISITLYAQLKTVIEDFEGYADGQTNFSVEGIFSYGDAKLMTEQKVTTGYGYSGLRALKVSVTHEKFFAGWGKGVGLFKELDVNTDYFSFYVLSPPENKFATDLNIIIEDDDNGNGTFENDKDDQWTYKLTVQSSTHWQLFSIPLKQFIRGNKGGDGIFNINHKEGRLLTVAFNFLNTEKLGNCHHIYFDFLSFSKNKFQPENLFDPPKANKDDFCVFGFWSEEGKSGNPIDILTAFENLYGCFKPGKIGVVSFYNPLSIDGNKKPNFFPDVGQINGLIEQGYLPMITFEAHHKSDIPNDKQPNLYSITEGWYDGYFAEWGRTIAQANGTVLLRILHEFNGDWYPWCIANNDKNPELYIKAYRRIADIFRNNGAHNVKFVWCPNSISTPQESWNYIVNAYPGNEYVDFIGVDIFNGAGQKGIPQWRSFRHEVSDFYGLVTEKFSQKPLIICETSSRERLPQEKGYYTDKSDWIRAMIETLKTDMSKFRLLVWFNETPPFRIESSTESFGTFFKYFLLDSYFQAKPEQLIKK